MKKVMFFLLGLSLGLLFAQSKSPADKTVYQAQKKLQLLGYHKDSLDSLLNPSMLESIKKFQKDNELTETGALDKQTTHLITIKNHLRARAKVVSHAEIIKTIKAKGFNHPANLAASQLSPSVKGNFKHLFKARTIKNDRVVLDFVTDLMWQQAGSTDLLIWSNVNAYISEVNKKRFAGFADWRLPTIEELGSLLESGRKGGNQFIDGQFDATQTWCWTVDTVQKDPEQTLWIVNFDEGQIDQNNVNLDSYVRLVRSLR